MATDTPNPSANVVTQAVSDVVIDAELAATLFNPQERKDRIEMLLHSTVLSALHSSLPEQIDGSKDDVRALGQLMTKVRDGIRRLHDGIGKVHETNVDGVARAIATTVQSTPFGLEALERPDKGINLSLPVAEAIKKSVAAIQGILSEFTVQKLTDDEQFQALSLVPEGRSLTVESFLRLPKVEKPKMSFEKKEDNANFISTLFTTEGAASESSDVQEEIPEFRWSWTDDELFTKRQVPYMRKLRMDDSEIAAAQNVFESDLSARFTEWKKGCKKLASSSETFFGEDGIGRPRDEALDIMERKFTEHLSEVGKMLAEWIRGTMTWGDAMDTIVSLHQKKMETYFLFPGAPKPLFIRPALKKFADLLKQSEEVTIPMLSTQHVSQTNGYYYRITPGGSIKQKSLQELYVSCSARDSEDIETTTRAYLRNKYHANPVKRSNERAATKKAIEALSVQLVNLSNEAPENFIYSSIQELTGFLKTWLHKALITISKFSDKELSLTLLSEVKNAVSHHISWNFREVALTRPFLSGMDVTHPEYVHVIKNFYSEIPDNQLVSTTTEVPELAATSPIEQKLALFADVLDRAWKGIRDEALGVLQITKGTDDIPIENGIKSQIISDEKERELSTVTRKVPKDGLRTQAGAKAYLAAIQTVIDAIPATIDIGNDSVVVPEGFKAHLVSQLDELSQHILPLCAEGDVASEGSEEADVQFIANPLDEILKEARELKRARAEAGAGSSSDSSGKKAESVTAVLQELCDVTSHAHLVDVVSRAAAARIADAASVVIGSHAGGMDAEEIRSLSESLQGLIDAGTAGAKEALSTVEMTSLTPEQISSAVDAAFDAALYTAISLPPGVTEAMTTALADQKKNLTAVATGAYDIAGYIDVSNERGTTTFTRHVDIMIAARQNAADRHHNQQVNEAETEGSDLIQQLDSVRIMMVEQSRRGESPEIRAAARDGLKRLNGFLRVIADLHRLDSPTSDHE